MKALIARQLYKPALVLALFGLVQLMVALDFNLGQVSLVAIAKGIRHVKQMLLGRPACSVS